MTEDVLEIINRAIKKADPFENTARIIEKLELSAGGRLAVMSIGKAAVPMAKAAQKVLGSKINCGLLVTKYDHAKGFSSNRFEVIEAAHPVSDENSIRAAEKGLEIARSLKENDVLLVLLSGGGSALFEKSSVTPEKQRSITQKLLSRGASIDEMNAVRRRLSLVKGGRLAAAAYPAKVITVALSDVLGNDKSVIASGITVPEPLSPQEVRRVILKYLPEEEETLLSVLSEGAKLKINDGGYYFAGNVEMLCDAAEKEAKRLGYTVRVRDCSLCGEARNAAESIIKNALGEKGKNAYIYGGETTVTLKGNGLGGRNQEMALCAAILLKGKSGIVFASAGSDGTDGPTDAAGGFADGSTFEKIQNGGSEPVAALENNDSYHALKSGGALLITGPTGTNVNDLTVILTDL